MTYTYESKLFPGKQRTIVTNFPILVEEVLTYVVNLDNQYAPVNKWTLVSKS